MVKSFRGKEVNMLSLIKKNEHKVCLGNSKTNARGDIIGKGGIIIKTREEQIKEYEEQVRLQSGSVNMKGTELTNIEENLKKYTSKPEKIVPKKQKKKEETEETIEEEIIFDEE